MKRIFLYFYLVLFSLFLQAQTQSGKVSDIAKSMEKSIVSDDKPNGFQKENLRFGGNVGANFGNPTFINLSPAAGYQFYPRLQVGLGLTYNYYAETYLGTRYSMHIYGISPYTEFMLIKRFLFLRGEYGFLNYDVSFGAATVRREWVQYPLVGGGLFLPFGQNSGASILVLFNLNDNEQSLYSNPVIRMGFSFGL